MRNLGFGDVLGILVCWVGAGTVAYFMKGEPIVGIVCIAAAYYLSKWIIMKQVEGPRS